MYKIIQAAESSDNMTARKLHDFLTLDMLEAIDSINSDSKVKSLAKQYGLDIDDLQTQFEDARESVEEDFNIEEI